MPEPLTKEEIERGVDPSVSKQWDDDLPLDKKIEDFGAIADKLKIGLMGTLRNGIGVSLNKRFRPEILLTCLSSPLPDRWQ